MHDNTKLSVKSLANVLDIYAESKNEEMSTKIEDYIRELEKKVIALDSKLEPKIEKRLIDSAQAERNIEFILQKVDIDFGEHENTYMLLEMMLYAISSYKSLSYVEEAIVKTKVVKELMQSYYFKSDIQPYNEKTNMTLFLNHFKKYKQSILPSLTVLNVTKDTALPPSLIIDAPKVQSIVRHLMYDLYQFIDYSQDVNMKFSFSDKMFKIELGGHIHKENSLFKSIFQRNSPLKDEKDREGLQLAILLADRLRGKVKSEFKEQYYKYNIEIPALILQY